MPKELSVERETTRAKTAPIRVAHLIHTMAYGGIETALLNWLTTMDGGRFEVHLFCFANPGETEAPFVEAAARVGLHVDKITWNRRKPVLQAARALAAELRRRDIDILHSHNTYANLVALAAAKFAPVKTITTLYVWGKFGFPRVVLQWVDQFLMRFFDCVSAHCEQTFAETLRRGYPEEKLKLLVCGFDGAPVRLTRHERDRMRADLGASPDDFVLINVARFWPEKAHDVLLEGFRRIVDRRPDARLWLLGVGPEEPRIRALCENLKLNGHVQFLGFRPDLAELLALADMQVHPSHMEGVALAICSGMAAGLPIVATAVGGLPEVLHHGKTGFLVPPGEPQTFAEAVIHLMEDAASREALGSGARRFIEDEYSLRAATGRVEAVYEGMLS